MVKSTQVDFRPSLRKGDTVEVISGREKGKSGKVVRIETKTGRLTIERVNLVKRHVKPNQKNPQGGVIEKELPLHYSKVQIMCPKCNRGVRHGVKMVDKAGKKGGAAQKARIRVCKRCDQNLDAT